jgi:hypothetical protein
MFPIHLFNLALSVAAPPNSYPAIAIFFLNNAPPSRYDVNC